MGVFEDYLTSLGQFGGSPSTPATQAPSGNPIQQRFGSISGSSANPAFSDNPGMTFNPGSGGGAQNTSIPGGAAWIQKAYQPAFGYVTGGSQAAGSLLRQGYEGMFRARAAGYAGGQSEAERGFGSQMASQGLSGDVAARQLLAQKTQGLQGLAEARGAAGQGLNTDLATLAKGTGTELAGLSQSELENMVNYIVGKQAASATESAGQMGAIGSVLGGLAGNAGLAAIFSDPRLKKNVVRVGAIRHGGRVIPIYRYRYKDKAVPGLFEGVLSTDVKHLPGVVSVSPAGYDMVHYDVLEKLTGIRFKRISPGQKRMVIRR